MNASKLRTARVAQGFSQSDLAKHTGCSRALISMIENGYAVPAPATGARIARALSLPEAALFEKSQTASESDK